MKRLVALTAVVLVLAIAGTAQAALLNLLVGDTPSGQVRMYDRNTGAPQGLLCDVTLQGFTNPKELSVGSDGVLVVNVDQGIARYDSQTGAYLGLWASSRHATMTQDRATNVVYTASPGAPYDVLQLVGGVESVFHTLAAPTPTGRVDHSIMALNMGVNAWKVMAYSDVSAWNVCQSTDGVTDWTDWIYLQNVAATGLQETPTNAYYNGLNEMRSLDMVTYAWPCYDDGAGPGGGVLIDNTAVVNGEINLGPNGVVHYATTTEVRVVTGNVPGAWAPLVVDPANLTDVFGLAWQIPEPATLSLLAIGALALIRRRRN